MSSFGSYSESLTNHKATGHSLLNVVQDALGRHDGQVLSFGLENLGWVNTGLNHWALRAGVHVGSSYFALENCRQTLKIVKTEILTVVAAQDQCKDGLETNQVEHVPGHGRHPADVEVLCGYTSLQHGFESNCKRERKAHLSLLVWVCKFKKQLSLTEDKTAEQRAHPVHHQGLGDKVHCLALDHVHHAIHGSWVGQTWGRPCGLGVFEIRALSELGAVVFLTLGKGTGR